MVCHAVSRLWPCYKLLSGNSFFTSAFMLKSRSLVCPVRFPLTHSLSILPSLLLLLSVCLSVCLSLSPSPSMNLTSLKIFLNVLFSFSIYFFTSNSFIVHTPMCTPCLWLSLVFQFSQNFLFFFPHIFLHFYTLHKLVPFDLSGLPIL